jgi:hypothetical protein
MPGLRAGRGGRADGGRPAAGAVCRSGLVGGPGSGRAMPDRHLRACGRPPLRGPKDVQARWSGILASQLARLEELQKTLAEYAHNSTIDRRQLDNRRAAGGRRGFDPALRRFPGSRSNPLRSPVGRRIPSLSPALGRLGLRDRRSDAPPAFRALARVGEEALEAGGPGQTPVRAVRVRRDRAARVSGQPRTQARPVVPMAKAAVA